MTVILDSCQFHRPAFTTVTHSTKELLLALVLDLVFQNFIMTVCLKIPLLKNLNIGRVDS